MGLIDSLNVAVRALQVEQNSIRTVSHNIANADTPGYSRQRVVRATGDPFQLDIGALGTGVEQQTVQRFNDAVVDRQILAERSGVGSTSVQAEALSQVEQILNEQNGDGVAAALSRFYASFSDLANAPSGSSERQAVVIAAQTAIDAVARADTALRQLHSDYNAGIQGTLTEINSLAERVAELNLSISQSEVQAPANDLRDQRDELVRRMSDLVGIDTVEQSDGQISVFVSGGLSLVQGELANRLEAIPDPTNPIDPNSVNVAFNGSGNLLDITSSLSGGRVGGLLAARDGVGTDALRQMDTIAYNLATQVNTAHAAGTGLNGYVGDFFVAPAAVEDAASQLAIDPAILADPGSVAAGLSSAPGDNRNALALAALRDTAAALYQPGDPPGPPTGPVRTLLDHVAVVGADVGQQARGMSAARAQSERLLETVENRRDEIAGVSLDEEMSDLIRLEAAFQANTRVVGTVRQLLEDLMSLI